MSVKKTQAKKTETVKGYKVFDKGLTYDGKQYAENAVFEAKTCKDVIIFHESPLAVLNCSSLLNNDCTLIDKRGELREFAEVESLVEPAAARDNSGAYFTKKLKVGSKIDVSALVRASISLAFKGAGKKKICDENFGKIISKADLDEIVNRGQCVHIGSVGEYVKIHNSGRFTSINSSGSYSKIISSNSANISSDGFDTIIGSIGNFSHIHSSGGDARIISGGEGDCINVSSVHNQIVSVGKFVQIASSVNETKIFSCGDSAQITCCGNFNMITSKGKNAVICCTGIHNQVKAKKGSFITLAEWDEKEVKTPFCVKKVQNAPVCVKTVQVDGKIIKEDVFYTLKNGEFVESEDPVIDGKEPIKNPFSDSDMEIIFNNQKKKWLFKATKTVRYKNKKYTLSVEGEEGFGNKSNDYLLRFSLSDGDKNETNVTHKRFSDFEKLKAFVFETFNLIEPASEAPDNELPSNITDTLQVGIRYDY